PDTAVRSADYEIDRMIDDGYYPIFVNWQSDLVDSYGEHLVSVTQGRKQYDGSLGRALLSPLYLFADLGRAVTRAPIVWVNQVGSDVAAGSADVAALEEKQREH